MKTILGAALFCLASFGASASEWSLEAKTNSSTGMQTIDARYNGDVQEGLFSERSVLGSRGTGLAEPRYGIVSLACFKDGEGQLSSFRISIASQSSFPDFSQLEKLAGRFYLQFRFSNDKGSYSDSVSVFFEKKPGSIVMMFPNISFERYPNADEIFFEMADVIANGNRWVYAELATAESRSLLEDEANSAIVRISARGSTNAMRGLMTQCKGS